MLWAADSLGDFTGVRGHIRRRCRLLPSLRGGTRNREKQTRPVSMNNYPNGWSRVVTLSGEDGGLGFHCEKCHLVYPHHAPEEVFHCGALQKLDKHWWER